MLGWFRKLMPRDDVFFDLFERHADLVVKGAEALKGAVASDGVNGAKLAEVSVHENAADDVSRDVLLAVRRTFITPFDRSAITGLITSLDDSIDQMQKTSKAIKLFKVATFEPEMVAMASCVVEASVVVRDMVPLLRSIGTNAGRIEELSRSVSEIEGRTDDLYDAARSRLFEAKGPSQPIDFWVASEILSHLEKVVDRLEDVAHHVSAIAVEHV